MVGSRPHWTPFLEGISRRSREPVEQLASLLYRCEIQAVLAWDEVEQKAVALAGVRYCKSGTRLIAEIVWLTGSGRETWQHLIEDLEQYLRDMGCVECRPICRLGWSKLLKQRGYRMAHAVMEKTL